MIKYSNLHNFSPQLIPVKLELAKYEKRRQYSAACCVLDSQIHITGGYQGGIYYFSVLSYDIHTD